MTENIFALLTYAEELVAMFSVIRRRHRICQYYDGVIAVSITMKYVITFFMVTEETVARFNTRWMD